MECAERCADFYGESRPRYSYIDVCLLPWSPPEPGTYMRVAEPPQGALPPWGPIKGPDRPRASDLCSPGPREMDRDEEPAGLASNTECFVKPVWPPSAPSPVCRALPEPSVYGSPLAVVRPDYRGKPSSEPNLCNCDCWCEKPGPVITGGPGPRDDGLAAAGEFVAHAIAPAQMVVHAGNPPPHGLARGVPATLEPPQVLPEVLAEPSGGCVQRQVVYAAAVGLVDRRREMIGSCVEDRIVVPPAHPKLADGQVEVLSPVHASASTAARSRGAVVRARGRASAAQIITPGAAVRWPGPVPGSDAEDERPLQVGAGRTAPSAGDRATVQTAVSNRRSGYPTRLPGPGGSE
jgi:hypothetical protein